MITTKNLDKYGQKALELVSKGENLFITGKAGTGKSTLLKLMVEYAKKEDEKEVVVLAPTGIAAKVAHGQTIHSFLRLPLDPYIPGIKNKRLLALNNDEKEVVRRTDIIFIDEVSMVRCDILDEMDYVLQQYRHNSLAFGGIQVVMFGDLYQLMPVVEEEDEKKLKKVYDNYYFFGAKVYSRMQFKMLELKHIYRQDEQDFKILLNNVRVGRVTDYEMRKLQSIYDKDFIPKDSEGYIRLTTHNRRAWKYIILPPNWTPAFC
jgi:energy-coupling factor transporter ATP-binding protein EcfA2